MCTVTERQGLLLCRLRSIAAHRDHFVQRLSVCLSVCVCPVVILSWLSRIAVFSRRHMHSSECCHYVVIQCLTIIHVQSDPSKNVRFDVGQ